jgi:hypothetical protein
LNVWHTRAQTSTGTAVSNSGLVPAIYCNYPGGFLHSHYWAVVRRIGDRPDIGADLMQIVWSFTAIGSILAIVFILTRQ